jgi:hypothetical protein
MSLLLINFISPNSPFHISESCLSLVPEQGSVGASGDLAPLAHLALGLLGEGNMWSPETGWGIAKDVRGLTDSYKCIQTINKTLKTFQITCLSIIIYRFAMEWCWQLFHIDAS